MSIGTNLSGRLRNTPLPVTGGMLPLFEAVVNSIHATEAAGLSPEKGQIRIIVNRSAQMPLEFDENKKKKGPEPQNEIVGFTIVDNGIGFDDENMNAFSTLDTDHKAAMGGRGMGRLLWLKAFDRVEITSRFFNGERKLKRRSFVFEPNTGVRDESINDDESSSGTQTTVSLIGFNPKYRKYSCKSAQTIANALFEHCLWYFVRSGGAPKIIIEDQGERIDLDRISETHMHSSAAAQKVTIKGKAFDLLHTKLRVSSSSVHAIAFCADNRLVCEEKLSGRIPGLPSRLSDNEGEFVYVCYVSSEVLNESARPERTGFSLTGDLGELFSKTEITWDDIKNEVSAKASEHLAEYLKDVREKSRERIDRFISTRAPRYRPIVARLSEEALYIDPEISDRDLDLTLHRHLADLEGQLLAEGHDLMHVSDDETPDEYRKRLDEYLGTAEDIKKSDLANYVSHRKVILDLLEVAIQRKPDGKYSREDTLHSLIMPMRKDSNEIPLDSCNLWLLDERLAFHNYLASDKQLASMPITGSTATKEPDLAALNVYDNPILVSDSSSLPLASIVVVEIKRPMRNDAGPGETDDPIEQALGYLERIRDGKVTTASGRPIPRSEEIPGYCYVVCDITPSIEKRCKIHDLTPTSDRMGFFTYKASYKAYVELISFDRLVNAAKERNRAFFDKLGLPVT